MSNQTKTFIVLADIVIFAILLYALPFDSKENQGLALLVFIAILWLTEALHVTITALLVPLIAVSMGIMDTKKALYGFADPNIFYSLVALP